jgi:Uncharacterized conserved protein H4 (DUF2046)
LKFWQLLQPERYFNSGTMSDSAIGDIEFESYSIDGVSRSSSSDAEVRAGFAEGSGLSASLKMRLDSLQQENRVLRMELETLKCKCKGLEEENRELKKSRVDIVSINHYC